MPKTTGPTTPTLARRQLGKRLLNARQDAGLTRSDVAEWAFSQSKLIRIETGKTQVQPGDVTELCRLYKLGPEETEGLRFLALQTKQRDGYRYEYGDVVNESLGMIAGLEAAAGYIRSSGVELIDGLVQTEDYARAIISEYWGDDTKTIEQAVQFRLSRQRAVFDRDEPAHVSLVMSEACLRLVGGSPAIMRRQLAHLANLNTRPNVSIRYLPFRTGLHAWHAGPFTIMDFPDPEDPSVVHVEAQGIVRLLETAETVDRFEGMFEALCQRAQPIERYKP